MFSLTMDFFPPLKNTANKSSRAINPHLPQSDGNPALVFAIKDIYNLA
jgi:hypothetical protein